MIRIISNKKALKILDKHDAWITTVAQRYHIPAAAIKAMLYQEMTMIDAFDPVADFAAWLGIAGKKDSSTGYAQIFGYVGLNAINFAVDRRLATYQSLGIFCNHRLDPCNQKDVRLVWKKLHKDAQANIEIATLNLLSAAEEMTGRLDFDSFTPEEWKLVFTRYNANTHTITRYGEQAYQLFVRFDKDN